MTAAGFWANKKVFLTGHTGFKGGWLASWLLRFGTTVRGYALKPSTDPSFFDLCGLRGRLDSVFGDIRDSDNLVAELQRSRADIVFHMAAQPLVRRSYREPAETFSTNVMGTVNLLEAARLSPSVKAVVVVTSDKCYENTERAEPYDEDQPMGGHDPYSASKGCAELVTAAYRKSFFLAEGRSVGVASARAGNVFGGGDFSEDRIVPDAMKALAKGEAVLVRNPGSIRPWQHVLEPLAGYLALAERLCREPARWSEGWNFGPREESCVPVSKLADIIVAQWGRGRWQAPSGPSSGPHEARTLKLDCRKARERLGWKPALSLEEGIRMTAEWHRALAQSPPAESMSALTDAQIRSYESIQ